jgi:hypothetical protein
MTGAQYRISRIIERCGEDIVVGEGETRGVVTLLHPSAARKYLADAEIDSAGRPLYAIVLKHDDGAVDDTAIEINGVSATVVKVIERQLRGVVVYKLVIAY